MTVTAISFLVDARSYALRAAGYVQDCEYQTFLTDHMRRDAVYFCILIIGEACDRVSKELMALPTEIPWRQIKGMRNLLVHNYWRIDDGIVYSVARNDALVLAKQIDGLIESLT